MQSESKLQTISHPLFEKHQLRVSIKRDDSIHPIISGNKWRKLKFNLDFAKMHNYTGVISFGLSAVESNYLRLSKDLEYEN